MKDTWTGMDPDDIDGYLIDYLNSELSDNNGYPLTDEQVWEKMGHDGSLAWAADLIFNIRNAVRAKNEQR